MAIINAMAYWNDYLLPSLVLTKKDLYTIPIATQAFYGTYSTDIGLVGGGVQGRQGCPRRQDRQTAYNGQKIQNHEIRQDPQGLHQRIVHIKKPFHTRLSFQNACWRWGISPEPWLWQCLQRRCGCCRYSFCAMAHRFYFCSDFPFLAM